MQLTVVFFGPPAFVLRPRFENCHLVDMSMSRHDRFIEQVDEAQPSHRMVDELLSLRGPCGLIALASARKRPSIGNGFDARDIDPLALVKIQQTNQIDLMRRDLAQTPRSRTRLCTMRQVAEPFVEERRSAIASDRVGTGEKILEHDVVSF